MGDRRRRGSGGRVRGRDREFTCELKVLINLPFEACIEIICSIVEFIIIDYVISTLAFESVKCCKTVC